MAKQISATQAPKSEAPDLYEQGMLECLEMVKAATGAFHDAERRMRVLAWDESSALRALAGFSNLGANIAGDVRAEVEKRVVEHLAARMQTNREREG